MDAFLRDLRYGIRTLLATPGYTAVAVLILALGIGANTTIFSFFNALLLRPYPFRDLDRLMMVWESHPSEGRQADARSSEGDRNPLARGDLVDLVREGEWFENLAGYLDHHFNSTGADGPERVQGALVASNFFDVIDVHPAKGRTFSAEEVEPGHDNVVVLSHGLWQRRFGGDPEVLGQTLTLDGRSVTVIGVMPSDFDFPLGGVQLWVPLALTDEQKAQRDPPAVLALGRLKPGVSLARARAATTALAKRLEERYPSTNTGRRLELVPLAELQAGFTAPFALVFQGAALFVLLITCANMANLVLARANARQKEIAVRAALGATRGRLVRQLLTESLLLSLVGATLALWLADSGVNLIRTGLPYDIVKWTAGWREIRLEWRAYVFTLVAALLTTAAFGLGPALQASRAELTESLKEGGRGGTAAPARRRLRNLLVVSEVTLACVLLVGAGLMVKAFLGLMDAYRWFEPERVMTMRLMVPPTKYPDGQHQGQFYEQVLRGLKTVPHMDAVALVTHLPADLGPMPGGNFAVQGRPAVSSAELPVGDFQSISGDYFTALHIPLLKGRSVQDSDGAEAKPVVVISDSVARRFWPGADPLGQQVRVGGLESKEPWREVVGVVGDVKQYWYDRQPRLTLYLPYLQVPRPRMIVAIRSGHSPAAILAAARTEVQRVDKEQPLDEVRTLAQVVDESLALIRIAAVLMVVFGGVALVLAAVGVYGMMAFYVSQRTHEIGVRMALGATQRDILRTVAGHALKLAALGLCLGLPGAFLLARLMSGLLFGVVRPEAVALLGIALGLGAVAVVATLPAARRAATVDPAVALRYE